MKLKLICLLVAMIVFGQAASPNKNFRCAGSPFQPATIMVADDMDLLPTQYFLNHI